MNNQSFRITFKNHLSFLWPSIIANCIIIYFSYIIFEKSKLSLLISLFYLSIFIISILPVLLLHGQYFLKNRGMIFTINSTDKKIQYNKNGIIKELEFSDINRLISFRSYGYRSWYLFEAYEYLKIITNERDEILVTCLLIPDAKSRFEDLLEIKAEEKFRFLPFAK